MTDINDLIAAQLTTALLRVDYREELAEIVVDWDSPNWKTNVKDWFLQKCELDIAEDDAVTALVVKHSGFDPKRVVRAIDWDRIEAAARKAVAKYQPEYAW